MIPIIKEAAKRVGGVPALATRLGVTRQAVYQWKDVPIEKVELLARETGLSRTVLRPDIFSGSVEPLSAYECDFVAWAEDQSRALRRREFDRLDIANLAEEVEDMAGRHKDEIENRMEVLLLHLLKLQYQSDRRTPSWDLTLVEQRGRIARRIRQSPSLRSYPTTALPEAYAAARRKAAVETGISLDRFPPACPYDVGSILDLDFIPDAVSMTP